MIREVPQRKLHLLAELHEPKASASPQSFRRATCVACGRQLLGRMWHCWLHEGLFKKEIHLCDPCYNTHAEEVDV